MYLFWLTFLFFYYVSGIISALKCLLTEVECVYMCVGIYVTGNVDGLISLLGNLWRAVQTADTRRVTGSAGGNTAEDVLSREKGGRESGR